MTFEEHLRDLEETDRRIQQRHEALAQTVELLAGMHRDGERRQEEAERRQEEAERRYEKRFAELTTHAIQAMDAITRLANIAASHDARIDRLEDKH